MFVLDSGDMEAIAADVVLIATGGCGQLWERTTNPSVATGDGLAMAVRQVPLVEIWHFSNSTLLH